MAGETGLLAGTLASSEACRQTSLQSDNSQFDLLYMPTDTLYRNECKYILSGIDVTSRYKVARPMRTKQVKDIADMTADIINVGPLTYPKVFQCNNGNKFKAGVTKFLEKHGVMIRPVTRYKHTHTTFAEALNNLPEREAIQGPRHTRAE